MKTPPKPYDLRPRELDTNLKYKKLSTAAKELYTKMNGRSHLSQTKGNQFRTEEGYFIIYTLEEAAEQLNCSLDKATKTFRELELVGLIKRVRFGYGRPYRIYVYDLLHSPKKTESDTSKKSDNIIRESRSVESGKVGSSNNEENNQYISNLYSERFFSDWYAVQAAVKENISYDILIQDLPQGVVDSLVGILTSTLCSKEKYLTISKGPTPILEVRKRLMEINDLHIRHVCFTLETTTQHIKDMEAYSLRLLWSAEQDMELAARAAYNRDHAAGKI